MLDAQAHRGPDDWGLLVPDALAGSAYFEGLAAALPRAHVRVYAAGGGPGAVLGCRRLSILDLSSDGRMPMGHEDGRLWVTHNGEIYNYRELRDELVRAGRSFRSATDTEAILAGYAAWGDEVLPRLRGMFAFAVFEVSPRPRLFLARDRFGIKPLYYYRDRERLVFASEVRALLASGLVPEEPDPEALIRFLRWGSVPAPLTTVKDVLALPAGHCLRIEAGDLTLRRYWDLADVTRRRAASAAPVDRDEAAAATRALLEESVRLHLVSDVPRGVFLSGGIDSSALVALAARRPDARLATLSVVFDEPGYSEAAYARLVAGRYGTDHREIPVRARDFFDALPRYFRAMDEPTIDGVNTYLISAAARQAGLTVVLSGTGGDEVFLGYGHHRRGESLSRAQRLLAACPLRPRRALLGLAAAAGAAMGRSGADRLAYLDRPSHAAVYLAVRGLFGPRQIQGLLGIGEAELASYGLLLDEAGGPGGRTLPAAIERFEFAHYLQNQLLRDTDVMSMAHSVETRVPYLDHRLVEYALALPISSRLAGGGAKPLLVRALGDALPRAVSSRPKMGFTFPFAPWMRQRADELRAVSLERKAALEPKAVEGVWDGFTAGRLHWSRVWALVVLARFDAGRRKGAA
jgi:asparagine synthase (glutamine-hydrolysing)